MIESQPTQSANEEPESALMEELVDQATKDTGQPGFLFLTSAIMATVLWMAAGIWLSRKIHWPDAYGYHCGGFGCLFVDAWHSPALLRHPTFYALALFAWYWVMVAIGSIVILRGARRRSLGEFFFFLGLIVFGIVTLLFADSNGQ